MLTHTVPPYSDGWVCLEMAQRIGIAGVYVLWQGEVMLDDAKAAPPQVKMRPAWDLKD
jgi:hypothetical protein